MCQNTIARCRLTALLELPVAAGLAAGLEAVAVEMAAAAVAGLVVGWQ
jgi:hypothetical protein